MDTSNDTNIITVDVHHALRTGYDEDVIVGMDAHLIQRGDFRAPLGDHRGAARRLYVSITGGNDMRVLSGDDMSLVVDVQDSAPLGEGC